MVLTDAFWRRTFGADPAAVGRTLYLNGRAYTIVGVLPPGFRGVDVDPAASGTAVIRARDAARATPVFGVGEVRREVRARTLTEHFGSGPGNTPSSVPLRLLGATAAVLLVACANVANLLLVRAERRRREIATRAAVGAGRARLVRQLFAEGLVLASVGGALGLALATAAARLFRLVPGMPDLGALVDGRAALFAVVVTAATTLLFALAPTLAAARAGDGAETPRPARWS